MARHLCGTIEKGWVAAIEAIGSDHTHLGPVSEENVILKHSYPKWMWRLGCSIEDYFPENQSVLNLTNSMTIGLKSC